jgi:hypothetical protein
MLKIQKILKIRKEWGTKAGIDRDAAKCRSFTPTGRGVGRPVGLRLAWGGVGRLAPNWLKIVKILKIQKILRTSKMRKKTLKSSKMTLKNREEPRRFEDSTVFRRAR